MSRESWTMLKRAVARFELDTGMSVDIQATMNGIKQFSYNTPSLESMVRGQQVRRFVLNFINKNSMFQAFTSFQRQ